MGDDEVNSDTTKLMTLMNAYGLTQMIDEPTQIAVHTLDHLYINKEEIELKYEVVNGTFDISTDHYPCIITLPSMEQKNLKESITFRSLKNMDIEKFTTELKKAAEDIDFDTNDFETRYQEYKRISQKLLDSEAPWITKSITRQNKPKWIDDEFTKCKIKRRKLERIWRKTKTQENYSNYVEQRKICAQLSISKQQSYYSKLVDGSLGN